jgi:hypothetical protein
MSAYMHHGKTTFLKRNNGQKSVLTEGDHHTEEDYFEKMTELLHHR